MKARQLTIPLLLALSAIALLWALMRSLGSAPATEHPAAKAPVIEAPPLSAPELSTAPVPARDTAAVAPDPERVVAATRPEPLRVERSGLHGRVVDDLGTPVQRFEIEVQSPGASSQDQLFALQRKASSHPEPKKSERVRILTTADILESESKDGPRTSFENRDGTFAIDWVPGGAWLITAHGPGDTRSISLSVATPIQESEPVFTLPRPAALAGTVLAHDSGPVAEAAIYAHYAGEVAPRIGMGRSPDPRVKTDTLGRFRIEGLHAGTLRVLATATGHCDSEWTEVLTAAGETSQLELRLTRGGRVSGAVDPSRGAVTDRRLDLLSFRGSTGWRNTTTDAAGHFAIENVIPQDYVIELRPEGYPKQSTTGSAPGVRKRISVRDGETTRVDFGPPQPATQVFGTVSCVGKPLSDIQVRATPKGAGEDTYKEGRTSADGRFQLEVDGPGAYSFYLQGSWGSYWFEDRTVGSLPQVEQNFDVPGGAVTGVVHSPSGKTLDHLPVTLLRAVRAGEDEQQTFGARFRRAKTDEQGVFEFSMLPPGTYVLRAPDGLRYDSPPTRVPYGRVVITGLDVSDHPLAPLALELARECHLRGQVVDSAGTPIGGALIKLLDPNGVGVSAYFDVSTDPTGQFDVESVAPGTYRVAVRKGDRRTTSEPVVVDPKQAGEVTIKLP